MVPLRVHGLDHVALAVPDVGAFVECLTGTFGMGLVRRGSHHETGRPIAFVEDGRGSKLELVEADVEGPTFLHLAFAVLDAGDAHEVLVSSGLRSARPPLRLEAARAQTAFVLGPEGVEVQVISYDDERFDG